MLEGNILIVSSFQHQTKKFEVYLDNILLCGNALILERKKNLNKNYSMILRFRGSKGTILSNISQWSSGS